MSGARANVLGIAIDPLSFEQTVQRCVEAVEQRGHGVQTSVNAAKIVAARHDPRLADIAARSTVVSADGQAVVWASRLLGTPVPERVAGVDLMERLLEVAEERGYGVYVLGAREDVLAAAVTRLRERHPRLRLVGWHHGYFAASESRRVAAQIRTASPEILFVAMSSPQKEYWIDDWAAEAGVPLAIGVGGAIDVVAGLTRRAPRLLQRMGLEWLFRLAQEPRRLLRRYAVTNTAFLLLLARALLTRRRPAAPAGVPAQPFPPAETMLLHTERELVVSYARRLRPDGLVVGTAGNLSVRSDGLVVITPTSLDYDELDAAAVAVVNAAGLRVDGRYRPSSELPMHLAVYAATDAGAVVHTHSPYATALATAEIELPPIHYLAADLGGAVRVVPYATFGTDELARAVAEGLEDRCAVLLAHHGTLAVGATLEQAYSRAVLLEWLATLYVRASRLAPLRPIAGEELDEVTLRLARLRARPLEPVG